MPTPTREMDAAAKEELLRLLCGDVSQEELKRLETVKAERNRLEQAAVNGIAGRKLGVRPNYDDAIHTPYPLSAGILREALREAYQAGQSDLARGIATGIMGLP